MNLHLTRRRFSTYNLAQPQGPKFCTSQGLALARPAERKNSRFSTGARLSVRFFDPKSPQAYISGDLYKR